MSPPQYDPTVMKSNRLPLHVLMAVIGSGAAVIIGWYAMYPDWRGHREPLHSTHGIARRVGSHRNGGSALSENRFGWEALVLPGRDRVSCAVGGSFGVG
ncbi:MAG: hypothetical protein ABW047_02265 [Nitrospiraceae bacterium]